jgi:folate-binding protein YgfZ
MELSATAPPIQTPLAELHRSSGAKMGDWFGCSLPSDFGNPQAEQGSAVNTVALIDKNYRAYFSLTGPDRVRYLNAILTNNIKELQNGQGNIALSLSPQGRILAEIETHAFADKLFCVSYAMIRQQLFETLDKYIIMDDVTLTDETSRHATLALEGPKALGLVKTLTGQDISSLPALGSSEATIGTIPCCLVKSFHGGVAGAEFIVDSSNVSALWNILLPVVRENGGGPMGYTALSAQRLAQKTPWFGYDFGEKQIPHEANLQDSHISYTKGCYTGQEIVERVRSRGQVNRKRVSIRFFGDTLPESGAQLSFEGKEVGYVTRAAKSFYPPEILGMAYVRKEGNAPGTTLTFESGTATVL